MSTDKPMLDRLMEMPRKELVDDAVFYHDGWIAAGRECNELKAENAKLRELSKYAILCSEGADRCLDCPYHDKTREPHIFCTIRKAAREFGIEVPE